MATNSGEKDVFWLDDITVLYKNHGYLKFVPSKGMTHTEQLNSITRFGIYLFILFILMSRSREWLYVPIMCILVTIVMYNMPNANKTNDPTMTFEKNEHFAIDNGGNIRGNCFVKNKKNTKCTINSQNDAVKDGDGDDDECYEHKTTNNFEIDTGYYDSDGNLIFDKSGKSHELCNESCEKNAEICRRPTKNNPFMNPSIYDMNTKTPVACNVDDTDIKQNIEKEFHADTYRDMEDIFNKNNADRQFFTVHHNIPNDQEGFARWCYGFPPTCKTNQEQCMNYQDLRVPTSQLS